MVFHGNSSEVSSRMQTIAWVHKCFSSSQSSYLVMLERSAFCICSILSLPNIKKTILLKGWDLLFGERQWVQWWRIYSVSTISVCYHWFDSCKKKTAVLPPPHGFYNIKANANTMKKENNIIIIIKIKITIIIL